MSDPRFEKSAQRVLSRVVRAGHHPDYEMLEAVVDGLLPADQQAAFDEHLRWCDDCARELADLRRFASEAVVQPAAAELPLTTDERPTDVRRWLGVALAVLLVLILVGVFVR